VGKSDRWSSCVLALSPDIPPRSCRRWGRLYGGADAESRTEMESGDEFILGRVGCSPKLSCRTVTEVAGNVYIVCAWTTAEEEAVMSSRMVAATAWLEMMTTRFGGGSSLNAVMHARMVGVTAAVRELELGGQIACTRVILPCIKVGMGPVVAPMCV
jgi:hypothetical protein